MLMEQKKQNQRASKNKKAHKPKFVSFSDESWWPCGILHNGVGVLIVEALRKQLFVTLSQILLGRLGSSS